MFAQGRGESLAVVEGDAGLTFDQCGELVFRLAHGLAERGARGKNVVVCSPSVAEYVVVVSAVMEGGCVPVIVDDGSTLDELVRILHIVDAWGAIVHPDLIDTFLLAKTPHLISFTPDTRCDSLHDLGAELGAPKQHSDDPSVPALIAFSNGTTRLPHPTIFTAHNIKTSIKQITAVLEVNEGDVVGIPLQLHDVCAMLLAWSALSQGASISVSNLTLLPSTCTWLHASPLHVARLSTRQWPSLKALMVWQGSAPHSALATVSSSLNVSVGKGFSAVETGPTHILPPSKPPAPQSFGCGPPLDGVRAVVVKPGTIGQLWIHGPQVGRPLLDFDESEPVPFSGFVTTNDLAVIDAEERLHPMGHVDDAYHSRSPFEVEMALRKYPKVRDCAAKEGEVWIVGDCKEAEILQWMSEHAEEALRPSRVHLVPALPKGDRGELIRRLLK